MTIIGWIGLGNMGMPMAVNLLKAGFSVRLYNRTMAKTEALVGQGAEACATPREVAETADMIFIMLANRDALNHVLEGENGLLAGLRPNQILVDMSTISPMDSTDIAQRVREKGASFLDAPVSGSVKPAEEGRLIILAGGDAEVVADCQPIFEVLGKRTIHFGENGYGSRAKLVINLLLGITVQGISEALLLADHVGIRREQVLEMIAASAVSTPLLEGKKEAFLQERFDAAFALKWMSKDLGLAIDLADEAGAELPLASTANDNFKQAVVAGRGELDVSAIYMHLKETNAG